MRRMSYLLTATLLAGCAPALPLAIREAPEPPVTVAQAQQDPTRFIGQRVRWGGSILGVRNRPQVTEIEVLARPLGNDGEPRVDASGEGRFIAEVHGFVDPTEYPENRRLTVAGRIDRVETRSVGEYPYRFPVLAAETLFLWSEPLPPSPYPRRYPWPGYDAWYYPGYGPWWGPW